MIEKLPNSKLISVPITTDYSNYWDNNWRRLHKPPLRRKGFRIVKHKLKFEHKTTKKQKLRWRKTLV